MVSGTWNQDSHETDSQQQATVLAGVGLDVRFGSKADIAVRLRDVRFTPNSGHWNSDA